MSELLQFNCKPQQLLLTLVLEHYRTTTEEYGSLDLRTLFKEAFGVLQLELEVVLIGVGPETNLLDYDLGRIGFHFLGLLLLLIKILLVIKYLADRRICIRADFNQIKLQFISQLQGLGYRIYSRLRDILSHKPHLLGSNLLIDVEFVLTLLLSLARVRSATARFEARRLRFVRSCYGLVLLIFKFVSNG